MTVIKNKDLVVHHNYLNESKFIDFTELELNLFITILYKMRKEKESEVVFKSEDIKNLTNAKDRSYKEFERIICSLQDKTFYLKTLDGYERIKPFPTLIFNNEKKEITVDINKRMVPVFKELKEQFTQYSIKEFVSLENKYGKRLYQLLKQYEGIGKRNFKLESFRELLDCTSKSYDKMSNLDKKVLMRARDDINENTSLSVDYIKLKKGRKVESVEFTIKKDTLSDTQVRSEREVKKANKIKDIESNVTFGGKEKDTPSDTQVRSKSKVKKANKIKDIKSNVTFGGNEKDTPSDKLEKAVIKAKRNIYVSKAWNKRVETKISKLLRENGEEYTLDILYKLYENVKQEIRTTLVQYINGIMKNIREDAKALKKNEVTKKKKNMSSFFKSSNSEETKSISNKLLPKDEKKRKITYEEFMGLDEKNREILEERALEQTIEKEGIPREFLINLKRKSKRMYFETIKVNL